MYRKMAVSSFVRHTTSIAPCRGHGKTHSQLDHMTAFIPEPEQRARMGTLHQRLLNQYRQTVKAVIASDVL
jgi:hypothetical protein